MISICITSGHENDRNTISALLAEHKDFCIASTGKDGYDALKSAKVNRPDIIITDFSLSDIESPELMPMIKRHSPATELIVLYTRNEQGSLAKAFRAGISGYLFKQDGWDNLASSVRCVYYGGLYVSDQVKSYAHDFVNGFDFIQKVHSPPKQQVDFSRTETQIFSNIALGYNDGEIAEQLNLNIGTVRNSVKHLKEKTGLQNRTQITIYALLHGIINPEKIWGQFEDKYKQEKKEQSRLTPSSCEPSLRYVGIADPRTGDCGERQSEKKQREYPRVRAAIAVQEVPAGRQGCALGREPCFYHGEWPPGQPPLNS